MFNRYFDRAKYRLRTYLKFMGFSLVPQSKEKIINQFHSLFYDSNILGKTWNSSNFLGIPIQKCPLDLFIYQEIIYETKPDLIIEAGTASGGSAFYLAGICDQLNRGRIFTIDVTRFSSWPKHTRIKYHIGSSTSNKIVSLVKKEIKKGEKVMVILDSDHSKNHVSKELKIYSKFVTKGNYLIVEDTNVNGHPVNFEHGPGPMEAVQAFLKTNTHYTIDKSREKLYLTFNPNGYLKRIK